MRLRFTFFIFLFSFSLFAQKAPDFQLTTSDGNVITLYDTYLDQGKSVVIELFFVNCPPCRSFAPFMADLHDEMIEAEVGVEFISLSVVSGDDDENVNGFKAEFKHDWPFAHYGGGSQEAAAPYIDGTFGQYFGTPAIAVIAPDGTVNYVKRIFNNPDYIAAVETAILDSRPDEPEVEEPPTAIVTGGITTTTGAGLGGVNINFKGAKDTTIISDTNGNFETGSLLADTSYTVSVEKNDDYTNGVTTLDIIFITKHILGIEPFTEEHQMIAADVNNSGSVTTFDNVLVRQLILGIKDKFDNVDSWVFEPKEVSLASLNDVGSLTFTGIKKGDLNNSANLNGLLVAEERGVGNTFNLNVNDQKIKAGQTISVPIIANSIEDMGGFQFTLAYDPTSLSLNRLEKFGLSDLTENNFNLNFKEKGIITTSWNSAGKQHSKELFSLEFTALKSGTLSEILSVNSALTFAEAYNQTGEVYEVSLNFEPLKELPTKIPSALFPNPSNTDEVFLAFEHNIEQEVTVLISNLNGQSISVQKYSLAKGEQRLRIKTASLSSGIYIVKVINGNTMIQSARLVKQ